jgi:hypothetical protein
VLDAALPLTGDEISGVEDADVIGSLSDDVVEVATAGGPLMRF